MADVHFLLSRLNAPPFSMGLPGIISLSEKTPQELLQLLSDVLAKISPRALQKPAGPESPQQTAERVAQLLRIVKHQPPVDAATFRELLAEGDRDVVHGVLKWVLTQGQALEKRAFVGYHLTMPEVPEELFYDPQAMELRGEIKGLQAEFIEAHKALDAAQQHVRELPALRLQIKQMEEEKERLCERVDKAATQAAGLPDAASYRDVCVALRQEHDREVSISQQLMAQQQKLERTEAAQQRAHGRLLKMQQQLHSHGGGSLDDEVSGTQLLEVLREDVARVRLQVSVQWPRELEAKQGRLAAVHATLNNGINTEGDLQRLLAQEGDLQQQVAAAQERLASVQRARAADRAFLPVRQAQQMANLVARKKGELAAKVARLQERQAALSGSVANSPMDGSGGAGGAGGAVSEDAWRAKFEAVKAQLPTYKAMKQELAELEAEVYVLQQTEEILRQQDASCAAVTQLAAGGSGDAAAAATEAPAAGAGAGVEDAAALEHLVAAIRQHKAQLAPAIQELRSLRTQQQDLEALHAEKKALYEAAVGSLEGAMSGLQGSVAGLRSDADAAGAELHKARARVGELEQQVQAIAAVGADEVKRRCQVQLHEAEASLRKLREAQRLAEERSEHGQAQAAALNSLLQVLALKQQLAAAAAAQAAGSGGRGAGGGREALLGAGRWSPAVPRPGTGMQGASGGAANVMVL